MSVNAVAWGRAGRGGQMGRLSYHLRAAAWGGCGPHSKVICPSLALKPPSGRSPAWSFVRPVWLSCLGSLSKTTRKSRLLRWWDEVDAWGDGERGWSYRKSLCIGENEQISITAEEINVNGFAKLWSIFYRKEYRIEWGGPALYSTVAVLYCCCSCRGHQAGTGGSVVAVVDTLLPQRKEQSPVNPSGLWPWALLSFTGLSTDGEHRAFSRHTGTTSLTLLSPPRPVSFSPSFFLSFLCPTVFLSVCQSRRRN